MSHGFSRFGTPSARERFHAQARRGGSFSMFLPTILATLFLFTAVITLNRLTSLWNNKTVRLINVDEVFPTKAAAEQNRKREFWETPPPPSPEEVINRNRIWVDYQAPVLTEEKPTPATVKPERARAESPRLIRVDTTEIRMPDVAPDTSLPENVKP